MSRYKQIEEMAKDIRLNMQILPNPEEHPSHQMARLLVQDGYAKASDVVRDIFNDLNEMWHKGRGFINYSDLVRLERLHEQKYTEEGK